MVKKQQPTAQEIKTEDAKIEIERLRAINEDLQRRLDEVIEEASKLSDNGKSNKDEALLRLVNILYDTPEDKLAQLTKIPQRAVLPLAIMLTQIAAQDPARDPLKNPLPVVWMNAYFKLQRSVDKWFFLHGVGIAREQVAMQAEQKADEYDFGATQ